MASGPLCGAGTTRLPAHVCPGGSEWWVVAVTTTEVRRACSWQHAALASVPFCVCVVIQGSVPYPVLLTCGAVGTTAGTGRPLRRGASLLGV